MCDDEDGGCLAVMMMVIMMIKWEKKQDSYIEHEEPIKTILCT